LIHRTVRQEPINAFHNERGHPVYVVDLPTKTMSMTIGELALGESTRLHRHNYETIIYITQGKGYSLIEDQTIEWSAGDALYVPVWAWHQHCNSGSELAIYVACENTPLLQNMGEIALREESHRESISPSSTDNKVGTPI
jgi:gentisate 1,2-dioxygenase